MFPSNLQFPNPINAAKKVGGYLGNVVREARDIPTAIGTGLWSSFEQQNSRPGYNQKEIANSKMASANTSKQIGETFKSLAGKSGTRSDQYNAKGNYVKGVNIK